MSSVLKALKKLEAEQRGAAPSPTAAASQRWASGGQPESNHRPWLLVMAGLAIGLLVAGALLWFGRKDAAVAVVPVPATAAPKVSAAPVSSSPQPSPVARVTPVTPAKLSEPVIVEKVEPAAVRPALASPVVKNSPVAPVIVSSPPPHSEPVSPPVQSLPPATLPEVPVRQVKVDRFEIPAAGQQWVAPPQLTVTEIFPSSGGERMAIVNGLPVMAGTMVEEALVEEIHDDRVVVSIGGRRVVLSLGRGR
jgi:hypothetical protein